MLSPQQLQQPDHLQKPVEESSAGVSFDSGRDDDDDDYEDDNPVEEQPHEKF